MKIRLSLRYYVLLAMLVTGISSILILSALSMQYFITGMDVAMRGAMYAYAQEHVVRDGKPIKSQLYIVASRWQDLPKEVTEYLADDNMRYNTLNKHMIGGTWFTPPSAGYFAMKVRNSRQTVYVASIFKADERMLMLSPEVPHFVVITATAVAAIVVFVLVLVLVLRKVTKPVEQLQQWAGRVDSTNLSQPVPDFSFNELNTLAHMINESASNLHKSVEREQRFLAYASHELRTPIAVIQSNAELLKKLLEGDFPKSKFKPGIARIERSVLTMSALTQTLLWLNRDENKREPATALNLSELLNEIMLELLYLIQDREIEVQIESDDSIVHLPHMASRIVLSNIIRNAYVHTNVGQVQIRQAGSQVTITNIDRGPMLEANQLGFGLGLELTQRLTNLYGWGYDIRTLSNGRSVSITFV